MAYREAEFIDHDAVIDEQMRVACQLLREWKRYDPIVSGGALWSWASGEPARDVDVFVKSTWFSRRKAHKKYGEFEMALLSSAELRNGYGGISIRSGCPPEIVQRYRFPAGDHTEVDLILSCVGGQLRAEMFDYAHCSVAFGPRTFYTAGAHYYETGKLKRNYLSTRTEAKVRGKLKPLWGKHDAKPALLATMAELRRLYDSMC